MTSATVTGGFSPGGMGRLNVGLAADGSLRWAVVELTAIVEEVRLRRDLGPVAAVALGRALAAAALLQRLSMKRVSRLSLDARGDGELARVFAECDDSGALRGLVGAPHAESGEGAGAELRVGPALGKGMLEVRREQADGRSWVSRVELTNGEIGTDVAHFLDQSEQRHAAVLLGVLVRPEGIAAAGGLIVEAMPGTDSSVITEVERRVFALSSVSRLLEEGGAGALMRAIFNGLEVTEIEHRELRYACSCQREGLRRKLQALSADDREWLTSADGTLDAECSYCGETYRFQRTEIEPDETEPGEGEPPGDDGGDPIAVH